MGSSITPRGPSGIEVAGRISRGLTRAAFVQLLREEVFRRVVEEAAHGADNVNGMVESEGYYREVWPEIWMTVKSRYTSIKESAQKQQMIEQERQMETALYTELASLMARSFGMTTHEERERLVAWVRYHGVPEKAPEQEYVTLRKCFRTRQPYPYRDSFECVILGRMPWIPETFKTGPFLDEAQRRYKRVFLYLWALFGDEIRKDHSIVGGAVRDHSKATAYVREDCLEVLHRYKDEDRRGRGSVTRITIDPEYGLLIAAVRAEISRRFRQEDLELQNFVEEIQIPDIAYDILVREIRTDDGLTAREDCRFFSERAEWLIKVCNQFLKGTLPWKNFVDERVRRRTSNGSLENWQILLEFEKRAGRWHKAYRARQGK